MTSRNGFLRGVCGPAEVAGYLRRLGLHEPGEPSLPALRALHRAHVERIPYETLEYQLGRPTTVDPRESVAWVLRGRGGYCAQINGAYSALLTALGYEVTWHRAGVQASATSPPGSANRDFHLTLIVTVDGEPWLSDIGLGDALHEPLPLRAGTYRQGPFTFGLRRSRTEAGGWRFEHDPRGSIAALDIAMRPAELDAFARLHPRVATAPESRVARLATVMRRDATAVYRLTGCMLSRIDGEGRTTRVLTTSDEWFGALADVFGISLADFDTAERAALWAKVYAAHQSWLAPTR